RWISIVNTADSPPGATPIGPTPIWLFQLPTGLNVVAVTTLASDEGTWGATTSWSFVGSTSHVGCAALSSPWEAGSGTVVAGGVGVPGTACGARTPPARSPWFAGGRNALRNCGHLRSGGVPGGPAPKPTVNDTIERSMRAIPPNCGPHRSTATETWIVM